MRRTQEGERPRQHVVRAAKPAHPRRFRRRTGRCLHGYGYAIQTQARTGSERLQAEHGSARSNGRGNACRQTHEKVCPSASIMRCAGRGCALAAHCARREAGAFAAIGEGCRGVICADTDTRPGEYSRRVKAFGVGGGRALCSHMRKGGACGDGAYKFARRVFERKNVRRPAKPGRRTLLVCGVLCNRSTPAGLLRHKETLSAAQLFRRVGIWRFETGKRLARRFSGNTSPTPKFGYFGPRSRARACSFNALSGLFRRFAANSDLVPGSGNAPLERTENSLELRILFLTSGP